MGSRGSAVGNRGAFSAPSTIFTTWVAPDADVSVNPCGLRGLVSCLGPPGCSFDGATNGMLRWRGASTSAERRPAPRPPPGARLLAGCHRFLSER
jgi:hypothetical protein